MTAEQLYDALVALCQDYGITNAVTYDHLRWAIESIYTDNEEN